MSAMAGFMEMLEERSDANVLISRIQAASPSLKVTALRIDLSKEKRS